MANANGWGDGSVNNNIGWGQGANNNTGWGKSHLSSWNGLTDIDGGDLPTNSIAPAITGTAQEGQTLTCSTGTWSGSPTYTYQWKRNGNNIGGATSSTYLLVLADVGQSILCTVTATNFVGSASANSNTVTPTSSVDADAQAFITAASITDPTQQSAINQLVVDLKGYNIWTKFKAIYPIVGGTASTHKWNLKDPRDLDAAFRLTFATGWTHSNTGALPNGTNAFASTKLNAFTSLTNNNTHLSYYSRTSTITNGVRDMGCYQNSGVPAMALGTNTGVWISDQNDFNIRISSSIASATGFYTGTRTSSTNHKLYKNGTVLGTNTSANSQLLPNINMFIGAVNTAGIFPSELASSYSNKQCAFASIGDGLTDTEAANFYTAVQTFQTTLGRQV